MMIMTRKRKEPIPSKGVTFGERLRTLRNAQGLTQQDLGNFAGVSKRAVCAYEHNNSQPPVHVLVKIADAFGFGLDELMGLTPGLLTTASPYSNRWSKKFKQIENLPERKQRTIMQVIDMAMKSA